MKSESEIAQSLPTPSDPMDSSLPGSSVHGIFQARVLEWGAIALSMANPILNRKWIHEFVCVRECVGVRRKGIYFHMGFTTKSEIRKELERGSTDRFYLHLKSS